MNTFVKRITAVSALALTSTSWGYPIYPYPELLNRFNAHRPVSIKTSAASEDVYIEQTSAENPAGSRNHSIESTALNSASSNNSFGSDGGVGWSFYTFNSSDGPWYFAKRGRNFEIANARFWFDAAQDGEAEDPLLKELKSQPMSNENSKLSSGLNLPDISLHEREKNTSNNSSGEKGSTEKEKAEGKDKGSQVAVSEPSSVALIFSGAVGLLLTRKFGERKRKVNGR